LASKLSTLTIIPKFSTLNKIRKLIEILDLKEEIHIPFLKYDQKKEFA